MIALPQPAVSADTVQDRFLKLLAAIQQQAAHACRAQDPEARDEFVQAVTASAYAAFVRLCQRGKEHVACATSLAGYAIRQVRSGRTVGCQLNGQDISSVYAQLQQRITIERLDRFDWYSGEWQEILIEDRLAGPAETAAARLDVAAWLRGLTSTKRGIAQHLARGETTAAVARLCGLSPGRVSQVRRELAESWALFQGDAAA